MLPVSTAPRPSVRDHGTHFAPDGRQAVTRRFREGVPRSLADTGHCWRDHAVVAPLYSNDPRLLMPDIDPKKHTLMIHGLVDQPLTFTMDDLMRFPSVTRLLSSGVRETGTMGDKRPCRNRTG